jgi:serine/threonine protein phosphatase PrpC
VSAVADLVCPVCGALAGLTDRFCEVCGGRLVAAPEGDAVSDDRRELAADRLAVVSDRGLVHARNEDAFFAASLGSGTVAVVCDGVSSTVSPEVAARAASDAAGSVLRDRRDDDVAAAMEAAVGAAQAAVEAIPWAPTRTRGAPSCTLVAAVCGKDRVTIGSVGDSRAYWIDDEEAVLLTRDDSWAEEQLAGGLLSTREIAADPRAHMITAWLGEDAPPDPPHVVSFVPARTGRLVLCTDGLWNVASHPADLGVLVRCHGAATPPIEIARALTDVALHAGGRDNITVAVADVGAATTAPEEP